MIIELSPRQKFLDAKTKKRVGWMVHAWNENGQSDDDDFFNANRMSNLLSKRTRNYETTEYRSRIADNYKSEHFCKE